MSDWLTPERLSRELEIPLDTLRNWRYLRKGPRYSKEGRHIRYRWADVEAWLNARAVTQGDAA